MSPSHLSLKEFIEFKQDNMNPINNQKDPDVIVAAQEISVNDLPSIGLLLLSLVVVLLISGVASGF